ncbi:MAG: signal peptidase I [Candidatus Bathyarchaeia archaeon]
MATEKLKRLWKNDYFQTALMVALVVIIVFGFWNGLSYALGTPYPMVAVSGSSMCMLHRWNQDYKCDGWTHPFERTLHDGDLVILQGVNPNDINVGDIIVYRNVAGDLVIHRVIKKEFDGNINKWVFTTRGDGNLSEDPPVSEDAVIGRVLCRVPWLGHIALFMRNSFAAFIIIAIIILLIFELVLPALIGEKEEKRGKAEKTQEKSSEHASET